VTAPRQVLPGTTYLVTRRCSERRLFLRPSERVNAIFLYVLAVAAQKYGIDVHAFCVLSNQSDWTDVRRLPGAAGPLAGASGAMAGAQEVAETKRPGATRAFSFGPSAPQGGHWYAADHGLREAS
jgi:hypothetical protein